MIDHIIREIPFTAQQPLSIDSLNSLSIKRANATEDGYLSKEDFVRFNNAASNPTTYTLPIASASTLGGVKIGTGFLMNSTSGILSVDSAAFPQYNLPIASSTTLGGLKIGDGLSVNSSGLVSVNFPTQTTYTLPKADAETLGGVKIGRSLSIDQDGIANIILPTAANSVLGGVKVGDGLLIDSNGVLSVAFSSYTLPTASSSILGGIKIGSGLNIAADGTLSINGSATSDSRAWHQGGDNLDGTNGYGAFGNIGDTPRDIVFGTRRLQGIVMTLLGTVDSQRIGTRFENDISIERNYMTPTTVAGTDLPILIGAGKGNDNLRFGANTLANITSGGYNLVVGTSAGMSLTTGYSNILIGIAAGSNLVTGAGNIRIGNEAGVYMGEATGTIVIQGGNYQAGTDEPANRLIMTQQGNWGLGVAQFADVNAKLRVRNFDKTFIQTWVSSDSIEVASINNTGLFNVDAVQIRSGTPLDGRVLTATNADGAATWRPLPTASATTPGLIKVGDGLTMTNGVLSVSTSGTSNYVLPTASSTTLGGIKIGTGFTMNATSGVLSVDFPAQTTYTLPTASNSVLGGIKIGTDLAIDANGIVSVNFPTSYVLPTSSNTILGGVKVGTGLAIDTGGLLSVTFPAPYVLPIATGLELGGFKVGSGFFMSENGVLSVTFPAAYSLPTASATVLGGVKIGSRLSIDASGVLSADVQAGAGGTTDSLAWHQSGDALTANKFMGDSSAAGYSVDFITKNVTRFKLESDVVNYGYAMKVTDDLLVNDVLIGTGAAIMGNAAAILFQALDSAATASSQSPEMRMVMRADGRWGVGVSNTNEIISKFHIKNNSSTAAIQSWMNPNNERVAYISNQGLFEVSTLRVRGTSLPITGSSGGGAPAAGKVLMATDVDGSCTWGDIPGGSSAWQVGGQSLAATSVFGQTNTPGQDIQFKVANADRMILLGTPVNRVSATFTDDIRVNGVHIGIGVGTNNNQRVGINALFSVTSGYNNVASGTQTLGALTTGYNNTATGYLALSALTSGADNSAIGSLSLRHLTTGSSNMALGSETMDAATTGSANVAIGHRAMFQTTTGGCNVGAGYMAHYNLTTGNLNTALGFKAANNVGVNAGNLYLGAYAGEGLGDTTDSVVFQAGGGNLANSFTPAISASKRMMMNSSGNWGVGVTLMTDINAKFHIRNSAAATALQAWTNSGNLQVASMTDAGLLSVTNLQVVGGSPSIGKYLTSSDGAGVCAWTNLPTASATQLGAVKIGTGLAIDAGGTLSTSGGASGTAWQVGGQTLIDNAIFGQTDTNGKNIDFYVGNASRIRLRDSIRNRIGVDFIGDISINQVIVGGDDSNNTRIGYATLTALTTGGDNTTVGYAALAGVTTGNHNTGVGTTALAGVTTGTDNTGVGSNVLYGVTTGNDNTGVGAAALGELTTGHYNTGVGTQSLYNQTAGSHNIAIGYRAGYSTLGTNNGSGNIYIGTNAGYGVVKDNNTIVIQTGAPLDSNGIATGPGGAALSVLMNSQGNWGFGINQFADIGAKLHVVGNILATGTITSSSDRRLKRNIVDLPDGLSAIMTLNPVKYEKRYDLDSDKYAGYEAGFVADDVREKFPYLIEECGQDKLLALNYNGITAVLVKAVQELLTQLKTTDGNATKAIEEVKANLAKVEEELKKKDEEVKAAEDAVKAAEAKVAADKEAADKAISASQVAASQATEAKAAADAARIAAEAKAAEEAKKAADAQAALDAANKALADMKAAKEAAEQELAPLKAAKEAKDKADAEEMVRKAQEELRKLQPAEDRKGLDVEIPKNWPGVISNPGGRNKNK